MWGRAEVRPCDQAVQLQILRSNVLKPGSSQGARPDGKARDRRRCQEAPPQRIPEMVAQRRQEQIEPVKKQNSSGFLAFGESERKPL